MSERISVFKNYIYNLSYQLLLIIVPFITMPYLAKTLGLDNQGTFSLLQSIVSLFVMLGCVGLNVYGQREIAYHKQDAECCERVFWEIQILRVIMLSLSIGLYFLFAHVNTKMISFVDVDNFLYFALFSLELIASVFDISWYYQGLENFKLQTVRNFIVKILCLALIIIFVREEGHLARYIIIYTGMNIIGNGTLWLHKFRYSKFYAPQPRYFKKHLTLAFIMFLPQIATTVYAQLDRVMLGGLINDGNLQVGVYDNSEKLVKLALTVVTSIGLVMLSRVANTYEQKDEKKTRKYIRTSFKLYTCLATPIMFGVASIAETFVSRFYIDGSGTPVEGAQFIPAVIIALSPIIMFIGGSNVFGTQYLLPINRMKPYTLSVFTGMLLNIVFNFVFIPRLGALGAALSTSIAELGVLTVQIIAVRKNFRIIPMFLMGWRYYFAGGVMFACVFSLGKLLPDTMTALIAQIVIGVTVYFSIVILLRDRFVLKYARLIYDKVSKKIFE